MFLSSTKDDDFDELGIVSGMIDNMGVPSDCIQIVMTFLDPEKDYYVVINILQISKHVRHYFSELNPYALGRFIFRVTRPEFLNKQIMKKYVYQLIINNERYKETKKFKDSMFCCFPNLQRLIIFSPGMSVGNAGFRNILNLRYLEIDSSHQKFNPRMKIDSGVLKICTKLEKLFLWNVSTKFFCDSSLRNLDRLEVFYASGSFIKQNIFNIIPSSLKKLRFYDCENINSEGFKKLHRGIEMVAIRKCPNVHPIVKDYLLEINDKLSIHYEDYKDDVGMFGGLAPPENRRNFSRSICSVT